jgi:oligoendopeptidase F
MGPLTFLQTSGNGRRISPGFSAPIRNFRAGRAVGESAQTLAAVLEFEKSLEQKMERVYHYASLQLAEDGTNNEYLARIGQVQNLLSKIGEAAAFVVPEIMAIDDENFARSIADPALKDWKSPLHKIRRMRPHVLSEREERLLALGSVALSGLRRHIFAVDRCGHEVYVLLDETGRERPLTQSSFVHFW